MPSLAVIRTFLASGETLEFTVSGSSMGKTLPPGSLVRVTARQPRLGEWVLYDSGGGAAIHRAVFLRGNLVYQMGDAERAGSWLSPQQTLGTAVAARRPDAPWGTESRMARGFQLLRSWRKLALRRLRGKKPPEDPPAAAPADAPDSSGN
jgi:hypothetical protein